MNTRFLPSLALCLVTAFATNARAEPAAKMVGGKLVNSSGMTLYTFDKDVAGSGKSTCIAACVAIWPPAAAPADAKPEGDLGVITRDDGAKQWAHKGRPLYLYLFDKKAGEATGDNNGNVWHVVK